MVNIRKVSINDLNDVFILWLQMTYEDNPSALINVEWWRDKFLKLMTSGSYVGHIAHSKTMPVGYIDYVIVNEPADSKKHGVGQMMFVKPAYRRTKVAYKLWCEAINNLREEGVQVLDMICADKNHRFWNKRGFKFKYNYMQKEVD